MPPIRPLPLPPATLLPDHRLEAPTLTVVIDTEEEFDWSAPFDPAATTTRNIAHQGLAQDIFDRHGLVPTYVIDYPVAVSEEGQAVLRLFAEEGRCEIGAHLHPWVNPPHSGPIDSHHSFPGNLPAELERAKLGQLTAAIAAHFPRPPVIYKAGRYGVGPATEGILRDLGYRIDVSVVPFTDFSPIDGPDFTDLPSGPYITAQGLHALPLSVDFAGTLAAQGGALFPLLQNNAARRLRLGGIAARLGLLERIRLSPEGHTADEMIRMTRSALARGKRFFMLTYHSSSLLPGQTSYVRDEGELRDFLARIARYFAFFTSEIGGRVSSISEAASHLDHLAGLDQLAERSEETAMRNAR